MTRTRHRESLLVLGVVVAISDHSRNVESALQQHRHLVPGLKHLTTVDAFDGQHLQHDGGDIDTYLSRRQTEHRDPATMGHLCDHVAKRR
jgi:hypothetical protein